jgi:phosphopantothenoylcysteine decarboxylase/phosphopantothenate--cysteine ligase
MGFQNKRVLITAGPTWVAIDSVRVISNIATGETGILLADKLARWGARVTLFLGPVGPYRINKRIKVINFKFFDELKERLKKELRGKGYDIVIHSAAVSDYQPQARRTRKIKSGIKKLKLDLVPTTKIIDLIKRIDPSLFLVGFKFEPRAEKGLLVRKARELIRRSSVDLAVANTISNGRYRAYIVAKNKTGAPLSDKGDLTRHLIKAIGETYGRTKFNSES